MFSSLFVVTWVQMFLFVEYTFENFIKFMENASVEMDFNSYDECKNVSIYASMLC